MKFVFKFLLQIPLLAFMVTGVYSIVGDNYWISALVTIGVLFLYTTSEYLETDE